MQLRRYLQKKLHARRVRREEKDFNGQWLLLFGWPDDPLNADPDALFRVTPPPDRFYADPFPVTEQGRHFIFFEEYPFADPVGFISVVEVFRDGTHGPVQPVIRQPYHLSYPWMHRHDGRWYMLPESHQNGTVELWECTEFPLAWRKSRELMNGVQAADTTPFFHNGRWWLFTALKQDCKKFGDKLFLFHGPDLFGNQWTPHPANPVRQGLVHDRPAGNILRLGDRLIRPAQDSLTRYGGAMELREITRLDDQGYAEHCIRRIEPSGASDLRGMHTFNVCDGLLVMDGLVLCPKSAP